MYDFGRANALQALRELEDQSLHAEAAGIEGIVADGNIQIKWEIRSDVENLGFVIYRKRLPDGNAKEFADYDSDDSLRGQGTSTTGKNYSHTGDNVEAGQSHQYAINGVCTGGAIVSFPYVRATAALPQTVASYQNYPNPFNPSTVFKYQLPQNAHAILKVYDPLRRAVLTLVNNEETAGDHEVTFDSSTLPSGVYFYRLQTPNVELIKKSRMMPPGGL